MGPSGSGKTTLLNVLSSIDQVSGGTININQAEMTNMKEKQLAEFRKQHLGFIFQEYNLLDTLTVKENILLPLSITKISKKEAGQKFEEVAKELGIFELKDKYPNEISGAKNSAHQQPGRLFMSRALFSLTNRPVRLIRNPHQTC